MIRPLALVSFQNPESLRNIVALASREGFDVVDASVRSERFEWQSPTMRRMVAAIVDLRGDRELTLELLTSIRSHIPHLPVLLYIPVEPGAFSVVMLAGQILPHATVRGQWHTPEDTAFIRRFIHRARRNAPLRQVEDIVTSAINGHHPHVVTFAHHALATMASRDHVSVATVASVLGWSPRRLRRNWPPPPMPRPKEFLMWLELLVLALWTGPQELRSSPGTAALSLDRGAIQRRTMRLGVASTGDSRDAIGLDEVIRAFRERLTHSGRQRNRA